MELCEKTANAGMCEMVRSKQIKACDCKCVVCGKQAVSWFPCIDPDIKPRPYCRICLDKVRIELLIAICEQEHGASKKG